MIKNIYLQKSIPEIINLLKKKKIRIKDLYHESFNKFKKYEKKN